MEKPITNASKASLIAAALVITGAVGILGTYANGEEAEPMDQLEIKVELTDEQKAVMEDARELFESGEIDEAKSLLKEAGIEHPFMRHKMKIGSKVFMENLTDEQKTTLEEARKLRESGDLEGAKALIEKAGLPVPEKFGHFGKMGQAFMENLTDEQKAAMKKVHELMKSGDKEGAKAIMREAGIDLPEPPFMKELSEEERETLEKAHELFKSGDEEAAKKLMKRAGIELPEPPFMQNLTDEQKATLEKARELKEAGDTEGAKALMESAGIKKPMFKMMRWAEREE